MKTALHMSLYENVAEIMLAVTRKKVKRSPLMSLFNFIRTTCASE